MLSVSETSPGKAKPTDFILLQQLLRGNSPFREILRVAQDDDKLIAKIIAAPTVLPFQEILHYVQDDRLYIPSF